MDPADALARLDRHRRGPSDLSTATAAAPRSVLPALLASLGDPDRSYPVVLVAADQGSDTVTRMLGAVLAETGLTVGTLVDRHLESVGERLARNGELIADDDLADALDAVGELEVLVGVEATWDEVVVAAALGWFASVAADVVVIDLGRLGSAHPAGRLEPELVVISSAGSAALVELVDLVRADRPVVLGVTGEPARQVVDDRAPSEVVQRDEQFLVEQNVAAVGGRLVDLRTPAGVHEEVFIPLHGVARGDQAAIVVVAAETFFGRGLEADVVTQALGGLAGAARAGQVEVVGHAPLLVVDSADDPLAADASGTALLEEFDVAGRRLLVVALSDRTGESGEYGRAMLEALGATEFDEVIATTDPGSAPLAATDLAALARVLGADADAVADPIDALEAALARTTPDDAVVVAGSPALAAQARAHLRRPT